MELPSDSIAEIIKNYPVYYRVSKQHYRPNLFYQQYCDEKPTFDEFISYIYDVKPKKFMVSIHFNEGIVIFTYHLNIFRISELFRDGTIIEDIGFQIHNVVHHVNKYIMDIYYNDNDDIIDINYDLETITSIYNRRVQCSSFYPNYAIIKSKDYFYNLLLNRPKNVINSSTLLEYVFYYIYLSLSKDFLLNSNKFDDIKMSELIEDFNPNFLRIINQDDFDAFVNKYPIQPLINDNIYLINIKL